ncbi:serine hydrolase domain-containing protein [Streptomyces sp. NPDC005562]|uniref:serine hydrolase domain-containing protein n=1 Tax=Streptomyces sp. NPDC005562 TaxID=3154890 RepID=UPI00339E46E3
MLVASRNRRGPVRLAGLVGMVGALLAVSTGAAATATAEPGPDDALQREVEAIHRTGAVGVAADVTSTGGHDTARAGTAEAGGPRAMPRNGRFRIGSTTKTFTAAVVLRLVGEGRLSLDDTVERWLPGVVRGNGWDGERITVRQLLRHTSGITDPPPPPALKSAEGYRAERFRTYRPRQMVEMALRESHPAPGVPGWAYSNTNYVLAAMIVEKVTGHSWEHEVERRIIRPLGLRDTGVSRTYPFIAGRHASAYATFDDGHPGESTKSTATGTGTDSPGTDVTVLNPSMAVGSGSVVSTAHDLNRFYAALLGGRLLEPAQLDEMKSTVDAPALNAKYGLGIAEIQLSCGGSYFGHRGELLGYVTWAGTTPDGSRTAVVYVTRNGGQDTEEAMTALIDRELCRSGS